MVKYKKDGRADEIIREYKTLKSNRSVFEGLWQEVTDYSDAIPRSIHNGLSTRSGRKKNLYVSVAGNAITQLAHFLAGSLIPPSMDWFSIEPSDPELADDPVVAEWFRDTTERTRYILRQSNFCQAGNEFMKELSRFGTAGIFIQENKKDVVRFSTRSVAEIVIEENELERSDRIYREWKPTARKAVLELGIDNVSESIREAYEKEPSKLVNILHVIMPRKEYDKQKVDNKNKPIASIWIDIDEGSVFHEGGFDEHPLAVTRWDKCAGDVYGNSPTMQSIDAIKQYHEVLETTVRQIQLMTAPPLAVVDESLATPIQFKPFGVTTIRKNAEMPKPLLNGGNPQFAEKLMEQLQEQIEQAHYLDVIRLKDVHYNRTAQEVMQSTYEREQVLSSMSSRIQSEFIEPVIERVFNICMRAKVYKALPPALRGADWHVVWKSDLARKSEQRKAEPITAAFGMLAQIAQVYNPENPLFDGYKPEEIRKLVDRVFGVPRSISLSDVELEDKRKKKEELNNTMMQSNQALGELQALANIEGQTKGSDGMVGKLMRGGIPNG